MTHPILVTGAADGTQGSTGRLVASLLMERGIPVRALVHHVDARSDELRKQGAEVVEGDLLNSASVQAAMRNVKRAYFTYPVADGLLQAVAIFAETARDTGLELVVNNSQFQGTPGDPAFRDLRHAPSFRNLLADRIFDWAQVGAVHLQAPPYYENVRALVSRSVAEQSTVFLHSPGLPPAFAHSAAYGDIIAATLALLALLSPPRGASVVIAWMFNLWGSADLVNAFYQANHSGLLAGQLGATYFIPTLIVPLLLITHGLAFRILLQHQNESVRESHPA